MLKNNLVQILIGLMRNAVRGIFLITLILIALFVCWFVFLFFEFFKEFLLNTIFSQRWGGF